MMNKINLIISTLWYAILMFLPKEYSKFRVRYYNKKGCMINKKSTIYPNVRITGKFKMGKGSSIAQNCTISGENAGIFIGENVMVAPNVVIVAFNHGYSKTDVPMVNQINDESSIDIKDDVWIGSNCTIGKGVTIGKGSIIASNSFVNKNVPEFSIYGGVPAKLVKIRNKIE